MPSPLVPLLAAAATDAAAALADHADADWSVTAADSTLSCQDLLTHAVDDLVFYAGQVVLASPERSHVPFEVVPWEGTAVRDQLAALPVYARMLGLVIDGTPPASRSFHVYGVSDPEGFAAMGAVEVLVHAYDISRALGGAWRPDPGHAGPVVARLFPDAPPAGRGEDATDVLLWCTGRTTLAATPRRDEWRWEGRPAADR